VGRVCRYCCRLEAQVYARGICRRCYNNRSIRLQYAPITDDSRGRGGPGLDNNVNKSLAPEPTLAQPGTEEKLRVMEQRVEQGYSPFHPGDFIPHDTWYIYWGGVKEAV
jgi:hypothetical protein